MLFSTAYTSRWLCLLCLSLFFFAASVHARALQIVTLDAPPLGFPNAEGDPTGMLVEIVKEALQRAGFDAEVRILPWKRCLDSTRAGEADGIFYAGYNSERAKYLIYPEEVLFVEKTAAWRRVGSGLALKEDLSNAEQFKVGATLGFHYGGGMDRALAQNVFKRVERVPSLRQNIIKLFNERIDIILGYIAPTRFQLKKLNLSDAIEPVTTEEGHVIVWSESPTYLAFSRVTMTEKDVAAFDIALRQMKSDGSYEEIVNKYK